MISPEKIEKVFGIIDREMTFIEINERMSPERKKLMLGNWQFVRDTFREVCLDCIRSESLKHDNR